MVYMNHIVANLKLLYLLERQSHFSTTGLIALQVVLMETVEYLVVGKEAHSQVVVDKTFVQCFVNGGKTDDTLFSLGLCSRSAWRYQQGYRVDSLVADRYRTTGITTRNSYERVVVS